MKPVLLALLTAATASAHSISMSNGFATLSGNRVEYILRMPAYEVPAGTDPRALLETVRFSSGFETARRLDGECRLDGANWLCAANYLFSSRPERLGVECRLYELTVPNHIHMLHARRNTRETDRAILDSAFPSATIAFRPPTGFEVALDQSGSGAMRVFRNPTQLLLLVALALAARTRREFAALILVFLLGEVAGTVALPRSGWQPSPRFAEAAAALALAYLALEALAFPEAGGRWLLGLIFGAFQAMFFSLFIAESGYAPYWVLSGAAIGAAIAALACAAIGAGIGRVCGSGPWRRRLRTATAGALTVAGGAWFVLRLLS